MKINESIKYYRQRSRMTQAELAKFLGVQPTAISAWELGRNKPLMDKVEMMSKLFNISKSELLGEDKLSESTITSLYNQLVPPRQEKVYQFAEHQLEQQKLEENPELYVVGQTAAGEPLTGQQPVPFIGADTLNIVVNGDSMEPDFYNGDIVEYKPQPTLENGEIGVFAVNGGITMKRFKTNGEVRLQSLNDKYEDIVITEEMDFNILGKVIINK